MIVKVGKFWLNLDQVTDIYQHEESDPAAGISVYYGFESEEQGQQYHIRFKGEDAVNLAESLDRISASQFSKLSQG